MTKYKATFTKLRKGQTAFARSLSLEQMDILLILCTDVKVKLHHKHKKGTLILIFTGEINTAVTIKDLKLWVLRKYLNPAEWEQ